MVLRAPSCDHDPSLDRRVRRANLHGRGHASLEDLLARLLATGRLDPEEILGHLDANPWATATLNEARLLVAASENGPEARREMGVTENGQVAPHRVTEENESEVGHRVEVAIAMIVSQVLLLHPHQHDLANAVWAVLHVAGKFLSAEVLRVVGVHHEEESETSLEVTENVVAENAICGAVSPAHVTRIVNANASLDRRARVEVACVNASAAAPNPDAVDRAPENETCHQEALVAAVQMASQPTPVPSFTGAISSRQLRF